MTDACLQGSNISIDYKEESLIISHTVKNERGNSLDRLFHISFFLYFSVVLTIWCTEQFISLMNVFDYRTLASFAGWVFVEIFIIIATIRLFQQPQPECFILNPCTVSYEIGFNDQKTPLWKRLFVKQKSLILTKQHLQTLELYDNPMGVSILTVYQGKSQIRLIEYGSDVDRQWIFEFLQCMYD